MTITESTPQPSEKRYTHQGNSHQQISQNVTSNQPQDPDQIDFDECLKDSPKFRQVLKDNLSNVENLENCMSKTIKQVNHYVDTGREHIKAQKDLVSSLKQLNSSLGPRSNEVSKRVKTLLETLEEIMRLNEIVIDQSARTVGSSLNKFINNDLSKLKEARKSFEKIGHEYDQALTKYSQPVKKQQEDSENLLIATSTAFTHTSLDLSIQLTVLQSKKGYDVLDSLLSFTKAYSTFFHQGSDLFEDLKPHISDMDNYLAKIQDEFETLIRNLPSKHLMVCNNELKPLCFDNKAQQVHLEGYLYKRASNGFKVWNRRWFILKDHQLLYQKRSETQPTTMEDDLRLLTVKPVDRADIDRRFCFEVLSAQKSHILQADSESSCKTWISAIQAGINAAFHDTELKSISKSPSSNEITSSTASSWGNSFSFKSLHQQATNRLNSMTGPSEHNSIRELSTSVKGGDTPREKLGIRSNNFDDDDDSSLAYERIDDQGRSYVQLRADDEGEDEIDGKVASHSPTGTDVAPAPEIRYPSAAQTGQEPPELEVGQVPPAKPQRAYKIILAMPGNDLCADCESPQPQWAAINLGITLCIKCAGIHRSFGVHLSKVRSLLLDTEVWSPEIVQLMLSLGNKSVNSAYLACYRGQGPPINADSGEEERENWIKSKYLLKSYMQAPSI